MIDQEYNLSNIKSTQKMRLKPGDLVKFKHTPYAVMWCPEMVGQIAIVRKVDYGPTTNGENDLFWIHILEQTELRSDWKDHAWTPTLWEKVET